MLALIIDDLPAAVEEMRYHVEALGHDAVEASCVQEAREILARNDPDYVLLDLQIPMAPETIDRIAFGEAFLKELARDYPELPVVVVTGYGKSIFHSVNVIHAGRYVSFVPKPFDDDDPNSTRLTDEIHRVLEKRRTGLGHDTQHQEGGTGMDLPAPGLGTIDVADAGHYRHLQDYCKVEGTSRPFSKRERDILVLFAQAQREHPEGESQHLVEVDVTEVFETADSEDKWNVRHSAMSKLRRKLMGYLPPGHVRVLPTGKAKGTYALSCFCIDSTTEDEEK